MADKKTEVEDGTAIKQAEMSRASEARTKITKRMIAIDTLDDHEDYEARKGIWTKTKPLLEQLEETSEDDDIKQDFWEHRPIHGEKRKRNSEAHGKSLQKPRVVEDEEQDGNIPEEVSVLEGTGDASLSESSSSSSSSVHQPKSKKLKTTHAHIPKSDVILSNSYPKFLGKMLTKHNTDTGILAKMRKYGPANLPQDEGRDDRSWPTSLYVPRLIPVEEVVCGPIFTPEYLRGKATLTDEELKTVDAFLTSDAKLDRGSIKFSERTYKDTERNIKWPQAILDELSAPVEFHNRESDHQTITLVPQNTASRWRVSVGSSVTFAINTERIWLFAPVTDFNRKVFYKGAEEGQNKGFGIIEELECMIMVTQSPSHAIWIPGGTISCYFAEQAQISYGIRSCFVKEIKIQAQLSTTLWPTLNNNQKTRCADRYIGTLQQALKVNVHAAIHSICDELFVKLVLEEKQRFGSVYHLLHERFNNPEGLWVSKEKCPCGQEKMSPSDPFGAASRTIKHIQDEHIAKLKN